jgi:hypothetical protein
MDEEQQAQARQVVSALFDLIFEVQGIGNFISEFQFNETKNEIVNRHTQKLIDMMNQ